MKKRIIYIILICSLPATLLPYAYIFNGGLSMVSNTWADFGDYLAGVSGMLNVLILSLITLIVHEIDSNNRTKETRANQQKELLNRFLNTYEDIITSLYTLKTEFVRTILSDHHSFFEHNKSFDYYIKLQSLKVFAETYIKDTDISESVNKFVKEYKEIIQLSSKEGNESRLRDAMKKGIKSIEVLISNIQNRINIYYYGTKQ